MRTTLIIPDPIFFRAKAHARASGQPFSALVAEALEQHLLQQARKTPPRQPFRLRTHRLGTPTADLGNREDLYRRMEE